MGKVLCFVPEAYAEFEVSLALHLLKGIGKREIVTVGFSRDPVVSYSGIPTVADLTLEDAQALMDVEVFLMPGGPLRERSEPLESLLLALNGRNALLAAICFGPQYLARAGLLSARRYTTSCSPENIRNKGLEDFFPRGLYTAERVVTDGNIITAQGHAFVDFAFAIVRYLGIYDENKAELDWLYKAILSR